MSLHHEISFSVPDRLIVRFLLLCVAAGLMLGASGLTPPPFMIVKPGEVYIEEIARLEEEFHTLTALRDEQGQTLEDLAEIDKKILNAGNRLAQALLPPNKAPERTGIPAPPPRPPVPETVKYPLPAGTQAAVPRIFLPRMPNLEALSPADRKQRFIQIVLPLILRANDEIISQRQIIDQAFSRDDTKTLKRYALKYRLDDGLVNKDQIYRELKMRVAPVPVSLALAQAAIESGWGLSRFTVEGNALYGQWVWNDKKGIKAFDASDARASVRAFPDLLASVRGYMFNLNSFHAYEGFRRLRAAYLRDQARLKQLLDQMTAYAETGADYVQVITKVITQNKLNRFNAVTLKPPLF